MSEEKFRRSQDPNHLQTHYRNLVSFFICYKHDESSKGFTRSREMVLTVKYKAQSKPFCQISEFRLSFHKLTGYS